MTEKTEKTKEKKEKKEKKKSGGSSNKQSIVSLLVEPGPYKTAVTKVLTRAVGGAR